MTIETLFVWLLFFALGYLLLTSAIFIRNRIELTTLNVLKSELETDTKISVCIPARNEENTLPHLLKSLLDQKGIEFDVHVLNDQSEDSTGEILSSFQKSYPDKLFVHEGKPKPGEWHGKPWACQQLGKLATGDIILFLDADTTLYPGALKKISTNFSYYNLDMLTAWPEQVLGTFWEKTVIPLIYYGLNTILPSIYVYRKPKWMPSFVYKQFKSSFAAANGQCIGFKKSAYLQMGGHSTVKKEIVEDVQLAKEAKSRGLTLRMFNGAGTVMCRMYQSNSDMFNGLRKNFLAGFGNSLILFLFSALLHFVVFLLPIAGLFWALINGNPLIFFFSTACIVLVLLHRLILSHWFRWDPIYAFTHPIGVLWFQYLGIIKVFDYLTGKKISWKGRGV